MYMLYSSISDKGLLISPHNWNNAVLKGRMFMNIFLRELKSSWKPLLYWCLGIFATIYASMIKFEGFDKSVNDIMANLPKALQFLAGSGQFDLSTASGYYGVLFLYLAVAAAIHAAMLGANILAKEERDKTAEFLLSKPVSRGRVLGTKILAAFFNILVLNIAISISSIIAMSAYLDMSKEIIMLMLGLLVIQILFASIGFFLASIYKKPAAAASVSSGVLLITFIVSIAIDILEHSNWLIIFSPFKYFNTASIINGGGLDTFYLIFSIVLSTILLVASYICYRRRDLNI